MIKIASRLNGFSSPLSEAALQAKALEDSGRRVIRLTVGDPNAYDFDTPQDGRTAACAAINSRMNKYADYQGEPRLRKAITNRAKEKGAAIDAKDVFVTNGSGEGLSMLFAALLEPGDGVLVPSPGYTPHEMLAGIYGGKAARYDCVEENNFEPDIDDIRRKITPATKVIMAINPNNPTGAVYSEKTLREIAGIAGEHNLTVISDEVYDDMALDAPFYSMASITKDVPTAVINGASKNLLATGWRVGWTTLHNMPDAGLHKAMLEQCNLMLGTNLPFQMAVAFMLEDAASRKTSKERMLEKLRKRRDIAYKRLAEINGLSCVKPQGAFYAFPQIHDAKGTWATDADFCRELLQTKGVACMNSSAYGQKQGTKHFRIVYLQPEYILNEAFDKLAAFMKEKGF